MDALTLAVRALVSKYLDVAADKLVTDEGKAVVAQLRAQLDADVPAPKKGGRGKKEKKDTPPRAPSAYNLFMKDKFKELASSNAGINKSELMKKVAALWVEEKKKNGGAAVAAPTPAPTPEAAPAATNSTPAPVTGGAKKSKKAAQ